MVILGGLEIVAAGYLLNEFNKDKVDARTRRRQKRDHDHDHDRDDDRPSRPSRPSHGNHDSNSLRPPIQSPPRPISAPPVQDQRPWQQQPPPPYPQQQFNQPPPNARPMQQWQPNLQPIPPFNGNIHPPAPTPGVLNRPHTTQPQQQFPQHFNQQPPPPGPGALQRPNTFQPQQPAPGSGLTSGPYLQHPGTFPVQQSQPNLRPQPQQPMKPGPTGPLAYTDKKTGRVYHNMYPPDHPMSRNLSHDDSELSRDVYFGDKSYDRQLPGDVHTGMVWTEADEDSLAYGKDYSKPRDYNRQFSYERTRDRGRSSPPPYR